MSNVFEKSGEWFYRDEDSKEIGPYETSLIALVAYGHYCVGVVEGLVKESEKTTDFIKTEVSKEDSDRHIYEDTDGQFHFWDETGAYSYGPYSSLMLAQENLANYAEQLSKGLKPIS